MSDKIYEVRAGVVEMNLKNGQSLHLTKGRWTLPSDDPEVMRLVEKKVLTEVEPKSAPAVESASATVVEAFTTAAVPAVEVKDNPKNKKKAPKSQGDKNVGSTK